MLMMASAATGLLYEQGDWSSLWWLPKHGSAPTPGQQVAIAGDSTTLPHLIFVPAGVPPTPDGWPLVVFLHGQGESSGASPLENVALQGPPQQAGRHPSHLPFAVLSPQKPLETEFFDPQVGSGIVSLIERYIAAHKLDASRVYLTGLSQGGIGTWGLASDPHYAARFAAIAPVCGGLVRGNLKHAASVLAETPIWAFHGANDHILPVHLSDESVAAANAHPGRANGRAGEAKYTRIPEARGSDPAWAAAGVPQMEGHASWVDAYYPAGTKVSQMASVPLYQWLLSHRRPQ